ncbi:MAG: RluA family pseudouridine synthase [bacterium]|nr:RluA family pseudouridine synthase [bacterium]
MPEYRLVIPPEMDGMKVRHAALQGLHMSSSQYKRAKFQGSITLDDQPAMADAIVHAGQTLCVSVPEKEAQKPEAVDIPLHIVYEDEYLWVIDKPAPLPSAVSTRSDSPTLQNALFSRLGQPDDFVYRPVNRLDKGTSGLMIVARDAHTQQLLQRMLHTPDFEREYLAVVEGCPAEDEGWIDLPIGKCEGATIRREVRADGKEARTHYRVMHRGARSLIRLRLDTGRTHQIRVHMSHMGCPITGDFLYGTEETKSLPGRFALHSCFIGLKHPCTQEKITFQSSLPENLERLLKNFT